MLFLIACTPEPSSDDTVVQDSVVDSANETADTSPDDTSPDDTSPDDTSPDDTAPGDTGELPPQSDPPGDPALPKASCIQHAVSSSGDTLEYQYNADQSLVAGSYTNVEDNALSWSFTYGWQSGTPVLYEQDDQNDGSIDYREAYAWYAPGEVASLQVDADADGAYETLYVYSWSEGLLVAADRLDDGAEDASAEYRYAYDDAGRRVLATVDEGPDGVVDERTTWAITDTDEAETIYIETYDYGDDGTADALSTEIYDVWERQTYGEYDDEGDGVLNLSATYTYDDWGLLTVLERLYYDDAAEVEDTVVINYTYDAWERVDYQDHLLDGAPWWWYDWWYVCGS